MNMILNSSLSAASNYMRHLLHPCLQIVKPPTNFSHTKVWEKLDLGSEATSAYIHSTININVYGSYLRELRRDTTYQAALGATAANLHSPFRGEKLLKLLTVG